MRYGGKSWEEAGAKTLDSLNKSWTMDQANKNKQSLCRLFNKNRIFPSFRHVFWDGFPEVIYICKITNYVQGKGSVSDID